MIDQLFPGRDFAALLFDFDGTVADTMGAHFEAWNKALGVHGLTLTMDQHLGWAGTPTRDIVTMINQIHGTHLSPEDFSRDKEQHYGANISGVKEITPVAEIVRAFYRQKPMAIVSGSRRKHVEKTLQHLKLDHYFDLLICAEDYAKGKPAPDCFLRAAELLKVKAEDCLVFEDAPLGIQAAHAAGMACVRVTEQPSRGHSLSVSSPQGD